MEGGGRRDEIGAAVAPCEAFADYLGGESYVCGAGAAVEGVGLGAVESNFGSCLRLHFLLRCIGFGNGKGLKRFI